MSAKTTWNPLWPEKVPLAQGTRPEDIPALRFYAPAATANGAAMVVLPGGGYGHLAAHEGEGYANWLASLGYAVFELRYRLGTAGYRHPAMGMDGARAVRTVRSLGSTLGYAANNIGIIGSSAGGHLAAYVSAKSDPGDPSADDPIERWSSRPDLTVLCYPVISMSGPHAHQGSADNLLGKDASLAEREAMSLEKWVTPTMPPCFLWHTVEDSSVPVENSLNFAAALRRVGVGFDLHLYEKGRHGIGLADGHPWTVECARWLEDQFSKGDS